MTDVHIRSEIRTHRGAHAQRDDHVKRQQKGIYLQAKEKDLRGNQPYQDLDLGLSASEL